MAVAPSGDEIDSPFPPLEGAGGFGEERAEDGWGEADTEGEPATTSHNGIADG